MICKSLWLSGDIISSDGVPAWVLVEKADLVPWSCVSGEGSGGPGLRGYLLGQADLESKQFLQVGKYISAPPINPAKPSDGMTGTILAVLVLGAWQ